MSPGIPEKGFRKAVPQFGAIKKKRETERVKDKENERSSLGEKKCL